MCVCVCVCGGGMVLEGGGGGGDGDGLVSLTLWQLFNPVIYHICLLAVMGRLH